MLGSSRLLVFVSASCTAPTHMGTLAVTQHVSLLIRFCHIVILWRCPSMFLVLCSNSRGAISITFTGGSISISPPTVGTGLSAGAAPQWRGACWENLRLNGLVGNPTSLCLDEDLWIFACDRWNGATRNERWPKADDGGTRGPWFSPNPDCIQMLCLQRGKIKGCTVSVCMQPRVKLPQLRLTYLRLKNRMTLLVLNPK